MTPPPVIRVDSIPEEGLSMELPFAEDWLASVLADANMRVVNGTHSGAKIRLDADGSDVILSGSTRTHVMAECVACLEDVRLLVTEEFQRHLSPMASAKSRKANEEVELSSDELDVDYYADDAIELAHWLREEILLAAPVHPRHEGDCPRPLTVTSNPTNEGAIREIDPRFAPLMKLARKD
jgi:uncharacterized metal-binding protein YceD (DUF177 family)